MVFYSSLKEVYGDDFVKKYEDRNIKQEDLTKVAFDKDPSPLYLRNQGYNNSDCYKVKSYNSGSPNVEYEKNYNMEEKYQKLREKSENERLDVIQNMNVIERPLSKEELLKKYNHNDLTKRSILMERLNLLQQEMNKSGEKIDFNKTNLNLNNNKDYLNKYFQKNNNNQNQSQNIQENFSNSYSNYLNNNNQNNSHNINQEFLDLFFLIIMGLVLLYIFEYIFKMGKIIGARGK